MSVRLALLRFEDVRQQMLSWKNTLAPAAIILLSPASGWTTQYMTVEEAQHLSFPEASEFEAAHVVFTASQVQDIETESGQKVQTKGEQVWKAKAHDKILGYFIVDYVIGKHLVIDYAVALLPDGAIKQVEVMQYRESYGGEIRNKDWLAQFAGKTASSSLEFEDDISNIGGATLSCRHVTDGVKRVLATFHATEVHAGGVHATDG